MSRFGDESCSRAGEYEVPDFYGALRGLRAFNVDQKTGHLTGIFFPIRWTEGVNDAQCFQAKPVMTPHPTPRAFSSPWMAIQHTHGFGFTNGEPHLKPGWMPAECPGLARGDHGCGFYAWHGHREPDSTRWITGVIDMFGQVEMGPQGLRSSKAKLVAMVHPLGWGSRASFKHFAEVEVAEETEALKNLRAEKPKIRMFSRHTDEFTRRLTWWEEMVEQKKRKIFYAQNKLVEIDKQVEFFDKTTTALYPSVPVFDSLGEMLKAFPVPSLDHLCVVEEESA